MSIEKAVSVEGLILPPSLKSHYPTHLFYRELDNMPNAEFVKDMIAISQNLHAAHFAKQLPEFAGEGDKQSLLVATILLTKYNLLHLLDVKEVREGYTDTETGEFYELVIKNV